MTTTTLLAILGTGGGMTVLLGIYDRIRNRRFDKRKQQSTIQLDDAQYKEITARAEQTNSANLMAVGAFWQGQFNAILKQLEDEQNWRARMTPRLKAHKRWDDQVSNMLGDAIGPPPSLDPDDDN